jgi:hypothetical protein
LKDQFQCLDKLHCIPHRYPPQLKGDSNYGDLPHGCLEFSLYFERSGSDRRFSGLKSGRRCRYADKPDPDPVVVNGPDLDPVPDLNDKQDVLFIKSLNSSYNNTVPVFLHNE